MSAAHTPGPWKVDRWNQNYRSMTVWNGQGPTAYRVATCSSDNPFGHGHVMVTDEIAQANARLIAAAPKIAELLSQARVLLRDYARLTDGFGDALCKDIDAALREAGVA